MAADFMPPKSDNIIVFDSYYEPLAAHLARTKLEAAGIPCFLTNENLVSLNRMYSPAAGGVRLHIYARDAAQAAEVLREPVVMQAVRGSWLGRYPLQGRAHHCFHCSLNF
jgi:hypothetical protein